MRLTRYLSSGPLPHDICRSYFTRSGRPQCSQRSFTLGPRPSDHDAAHRLCCREIVLLVAIEPRPDISGFIRLAIVLLRDEPGHYQPGVNGRSRAGISIVMCHRHIDNRQMHRTLGRMGMTHGPGPHRHDLRANRADSKPLGNWPWTKSDSVTNRDT